MDTPVTTGQVSPAHPDHHTGGLHMPEGLRIPERFYHLRFPGLKQHTQRQIIKSRVKPLPSGRGI